MLMDKIFINALILSVIFHISLLTGLPHFRNFARLQPEEPVEVTYYSVRKVPIDSKLIAKAETKKHPPNPAESKRLPVSADTAQQQLAKPALKQALHEEVNLDVSDTKDSFLAESISADNNVLISHESKDFSSEPVYLNYYNAIRSRIYKRANADKPYYYMEGTVKLIFTLAGNGALLNVSVIEGSSTSNPVLKNHALTSIRRAAPFPPFHESMKERYLTLRLTISFEK